MLPKSIKKLTATLQMALQLNKSRAECLATLILGAIVTRSVLLRDIASCLPGKAKPTSKYRRLQDFFHEVQLNPLAVAQFLFGFIRQSKNEPLTLALDATSWSARKNEVNILTLSVCMGDMAIPVLWRDLRRFGGIPTCERIGLIRQFAREFGLQCLHALVGDREFVGVEWFGWLTRSTIPFVMRLREDIQLSNTHGKMVDAIHFFHDLRPGEFRQLENRLCCGVRLTVCGLRTRKNELLILACQGIAGNDATKAYMLRWNIETGFEKLKTHGFHMESSRLRGKGKMDDLLSVLAIAQAWCYVSGEWSTTHMYPIRLKAHGRPEECIFARGLTLLRELTHGLAKELRRISNAFFALFRSAADKQ